MKKTLLLSMLLLMLLASGCTDRGIAAPEAPPQATVPPDNGDTPISSDDPTPAPTPNLTITGPVDGAEVHISLVVMESYPVQYQIVLNGIRPTPCHQILVTMHEPNEHNEIHLDMLFAVNPDEICIQVLDDFTTSVNLGSLPEGETFTVWVNGVQVVDIST